MGDGDLANDIREKALESGYEKCGIVGVGAMAGYAGQLERRIEEYPADRPLLSRLAGFADSRSSHPWAKSVVVLVRRFGQYRIPDSIKGLFASIYLCAEGHVEGSPEYNASLAFGDFLAGRGLRAETDRKVGLTCMRRAACEAGLGIIRRNNFFYTEKGSSNTIAAWLIDRELELKEQVGLRPCPEGCRKCVGSCPTAALRSPYSMRATACVSFITGFGGNTFIDNPAGPALGKRIYGCDACQSACPFNQVPGREEVDFPGLDAFAEQVSLPGLIDMDYESLAKLLSEKFWYISGDRLWKWKINALNAMKNEYRPEYLPWIEKARRDPAEPVRAMAEWVLHAVEP